MEITRRALLGLLAVSPAAFFLKTRVPVPDAPTMGEGWLTADVRVLPSDLFRTCVTGRAEETSYVGIPGIVRRVHALVIGKERSGVKFEKTGDAAKTGTRVSFFGKDGRPWGEVVSPEFQGNVTLSASTLAGARRFDIIDKSMRTVRKTLIMEAVRLSEDVLPASKRELAERLNSELGWVRVEMKLAA